jgi:hypothetical protein
MAIAHVCPQCGHDLARRLPQREPQYGLRLVLCDCGWASTRAIHPIWREWRWTVRFVPAALALIGQALAIIALATANVFAAAWLGRLWLDDDVALAVQEQRVWLIWPLVVVPLITGAWLRATFGHWRYFTQYLAWAALVVVVMTFVFIVLPWLAMIEYRMGVGRAPSETVYSMTPLWLRSIAVLGGLMVISIFGMPIGKGVEIMHGRRRQRRWRRRRRRWRAKGLSA